MTELVQPIKRVEQYLYALCVLDFSNIPVPRSRLEIFTHAMITGEIPEIAPETREEEYMVAIIKGDVANLPTPKSRADHLLYRICLGETEIRDIELETRYEMLLAYLAEHGGTDLEYALINFTKAFETLYNTVEMPVKSAILKGNTLVNIFDNWVNNVGTLTPVQTQDGYFLFTGDNKYARVNLDDIPTFKRGAEYTFIYRIKNSTYDGENNNSLRLDVGATTSVYAHNVTNGIWKIKKSFSTDETNCFVKVVSWVGSTGSAEVSIQIIEGDHTNVDIPYFEGMKSVQMPVLKTVGKNLFNKATCDLGYTINGSNINEVTENKARFITDFIPTQKNMTLQVFTADKKFKNIIGFDKNKKPIKVVAEANKTKCILTLEDNIAYIRVPVCGLTDEKTAFTQADIDNVEIQIEYGTSFSDTYEPYKSNILTVNEEVELGSVGEVKDELDLLTGKITQRTDIRPYQESDESDSEVLTDMTNTRYKLAQEVVKTVDLTIKDQDGNAVPCLNTFNDATHVSINAVDIIPQVDLEVLVDANTMASVASQQDDLVIAQASLSDAIDAQNDDIEMTKQALDEVKGE